MFLTEGLEKTRLSATSRTLPEDFIGRDVSERGD